MATPDDAEFFEDLYLQRDSNFTEGANDEKAGVTSTGLGDERRLVSRSRKTLFKDFVPSISVYSLDDNSIFPPGMVFSTTRVLFSGVQESTQEATQILKTFSSGRNSDDTHVTFFGEQPRVYSFAGTLFHLGVEDNSSLLQSGSNISPDNRNDYNWYDSFKYAYENLLKGTKCAELGLQCRVSYDYHYSQGYLLSFSSNFSVDSPGEIGFTMNLLVKKSGAYHVGDSITAKSYIDAISSSPIDEQPNYGAFGKDSLGDAGFLA